MINADSLPTSSSFPKPPQRSFGTDSVAPLGAAVPKVDAMGAASAKAGISQKTLFGFDLRSLGTVAGLTLFFVVAMAGVIISMRTRFGAQDFSPTAPERPSADVVRTATCSLTFVVASPSPSPSTSPSPSPSTSPSPSPSTSPTPTPSPTPSPTPLAECNYPCTNTVDCANVNHLCYQGRCRLIDNPTSPTCTMPGATPTPTPVSTPRPTATPVTVAPTYLCNENCVNNADCSNAAHICYNSRCRLADNPESPTCSYPQGTQPELPVELPKTGSDGLETWLKAGLGVLGVGAVLLLLL